MRKNVITNLLTLPLIMSVIAAVFVSAPAQATDASIGLAPFIKSGLKINYRKVDSVSGNCPMTVLTSDQWKTETYVYTIDWAKNKYISYRQTDIRRVGMAGEFSVKAGKARSPQTGTDIVLDVQTPQEAKKMLAVLRDIRKGCGGVAGSEEEG